MATTARRNGRGFPKGDAAGQAGTAVQTGTCRDAFGNEVGADGRVVRLEDGTPVRHIGRAPYTMSGGIAPDDENGVEELAFSWLGGDPEPRVEHESLLNALYLLADGDLCSVNAGTAVRIPRHQFPAWLDDEGCPWSLTDAQVERIVALREHVAAEPLPTGASTEPAEFGVVVPCRG
jgi:hypothetical protein